MIKIYNSLTKQKEVLEPLEPNHVRIYVCGITVYDYCHIGHARCYVVFDTVVRYLRSHGYNVEYVRNITDVNDSIIKRAVENGESEKSLVERFTKFMYEDFDALNILRPDHEPKATESIQGMQDIIQSLIDKEMAYQGLNENGKPGDVFFAVDKFEGYGELSNRRLEDLQAGARIEVNESKRNPFDFALWKLSDDDSLAWESPWGKGRPGWHIECSAMAKHHFGDHFDIHGGGMDLKFPHHENERAQSCGASGKDFVNIWMHNGFVNMDDEKMSKSLDNFFTIREVLKHYHSEEIRLFLLSSHYRGPINYSDKELDNAKAGLQRMYTALRGLKINAEAAIGTEFEHEFNTVMNDDFNTPMALAVLFELARHINTIKEKHPERANKKAALLVKLGQTLGILYDDAESYLQSDVDLELSSEEIDLMIAARLQAREDKNWAESDRIRDELLANGVVLEDSAGVTTWRCK